MVTLPGVIEMEEMNNRMPTEAEEARFWALIEQAWADVGTEAQNARRVLRERNLLDDQDPHCDQDMYVVDPFLDTFLAKLRARSVDFTREELADLDRVLERKLYDIDRADIHAVTDGSDDGFLYARGFIVAAGHAFYQAVVADPRVAVLDGDCEAMCYFFAHLHNERFGDYPDTGSGICRESGNNAMGWAD
ncbi:hypothetical protein GCM10009662_84280 [Catellatospora coxensis]|uniref:DUF4240 domain-containing protein n=2 Tax=Catellatospora coxensis TaxID=310354 RepID=A0A8J3P5G1_9ACTN|nr:hypothetical protein Cco03nite_11440 [Catellatospora coxensis]